MKSLFFNKKTKKNVIPKKLVENFPLFNSFTQRELNTFLAHCFIKTFLYNETLFTNTQKRSIFYILVEGEVAIERTLGEDTLVVDIATCGEYIAEHALFNPDAIHDHSARIHSSKATVIGITGTRFQKLPLDIRHKLIFSLVPVISDNFSHASNRILTLFEIGSIIGNTNVPLSTVCQSLLDVLTKSIHAHKALFLIPAHHPQKMILIAQKGYGTHLLKTVYAKNEDPIFEDIFKTKKILNIPQKDYMLSKKKSSFISRSMLVSPLIASGRVQGALVLVDKMGNSDFNTNNELLLTIVSHMIALRIEQAMEKQAHEAQMELKQEYIYS